MTDRKSQLLKMLAGQPDDVFLHFALAMEHVKLGEADQAVEQFDRVLALDGGHVAAWSQKAALYEKLGRFDLAKQTYRKAVESARARNDRHAAEKMQEALDRLVRTTGP